MEERSSEQMEVGVAHEFPRCIDEPARVNLSEVQDAREQRSHIAIIQMAPPASSGSSKCASVSSPAHGAGVVVKSGGVVVPKPSRSAGSAQSRALRTGGRSENVSKKKRHHCSVQGCAYSTPHSKDLARHMRKHTSEKPFTCDRCTKSFTRYDKLVGHIRTHEGHRRFACQFCSYAAVDSSSLRKHMRRIHSDDRPYKCQLCPYASKDSSQLVVHLRHHTGDSPYVCTYNGCDAAFKTPSDLSRHTRLHTGEKPYKCPYCDYRAAVKCNLNVHMKRHTNPVQKGVTKALQTNPDLPIDDDFETDQDCKSTGSDVLRESPATPLLPFQYACKFCNYKADTIGDFNDHLEESHPSTNAAILNSAGVRKNRKKASQNSIKNYTDERNFHCSTCNASFVCQESLRCHIRQHGTIPNKPANVAPELYTPPNRLRIANELDNVQRYTKVDYQRHEVQRMPVSQSVITENPSVIASNSCIAVQQQPHTPTNNEMYLVNFNNVSDANNEDNRLNIIYHDAHSSMNSNNVL